MESLAAYYWCVKMSRWYVEHGLEYISFYVPKHITHMVACSRPSRCGSQRAARVSSDCLCMNFSVKRDDFFPEIFVWHKCLVFFVCVHMYEPVGVKTQK